MARKRKKLKNIEYNSKEYWNKLLAQDGLSMSQGLDPRQIYVGDSAAIDIVQEERSQRETGRTLPKPPCP